MTELMSTSASLPGVKCSSLTLNLVRRKAPIETTARTPTTPNTVRGHHECADDPENICPRAVEPPQAWAWRPRCRLLQSEARAAFSMAASIFSKLDLSIESITGPVTLPKGPPLGTYL